MSLELLHAILIPFLYEAATNNDLYLPFGLSGVEAQSALGNEELSPNGGFVAASYRIGLRAFPIPNAQCPIPHL